jgi:hypothetical protein
MIGNHKKMMKTTYTIPDELANAINKAFASIQYQPTYQKAVDIFGRYFLKQNFYNEKTDDEIFGNITISEPYTLNFKELAVDVYVDSVKKYIFSVHIKGSDNEISPYVRFYYWYMEEVGTDWERNHLATVWELKNQIPHKKPLKQTVKNIYKKYEFFLIALAFAVILNTTPSLTYLLNLKYFTLVILGMKLLKAKI